jgi:DNA repair/transcription protein MET18/MMS19
MFASYLIASFYSTGILLLGEILSRISVKWLDVNTITTLSDFFISRLVSFDTLIMWIIIVSSILF